MTNHFRVVRAAEGYAWPSGTHEVPALLHMMPDSLAERIGTPLEGAIEDGLGAYTGCGLELPSGARVELIAYEHGLGWHWFELRVDAAAAGAPIARECIALLGLSPEMVVWLAEDAS